MDGVIRFRLDVRSKRIKSSLCFHEQET